jgi:hypothetical protein
MQLVNLRIENFRGIKSGHVRFAPHTVLIGANNSGKTTIIEALALLFGRDRMIRSLTEHDFFGSNPGPTDRIRLIATVAGFEGDDVAEHPAWFNDSRGVPKWWSASSDELSPIRPDQTWSLACQIGFSARFDRPSLEVETARYFHDDDTLQDPFADDVVSHVPAKLIRDIGFFLVPANRTWDKMVSFSSELFRRVVALGDGQPADSVLSERDRVRAPPHPLEADPNLRPIIAELDRELESFFLAKPKLNLRVTATDSESLLEAVVPHYSERGDAPTLPAKRHGSGLISLQQLLLLLQFGRRRAEAGEGFWMAMEEPELHVPPQLQGRLVHRVQALSTQTFVSTHSPVVAALHRPQSVVVLRNERGLLKCTPLLRGEMPAATPNAIRKLFQLNRIETIAALMHDVVAVPEGRLDYDWLRIIVKGVDLKQDWTIEGTRFSSFVGVVPTHDASVVATVAAILPLHPRTHAIVDGDAAGVQYTNTLLAAGAYEPASILRWPHEWTIEDVIGWVLSADALGALAFLRETVTPIRTIPELVGRLKSTDRANGGLKGDQMAIEAVAEAISNVATCRGRATEWLEAVTDALLGNPTPRFQATEHHRVKVFLP